MSQKSNIVKICKDISGIKGVLVMNISKTLRNYAVRDNKLSRFLFQRLEIHELLVDFVLFPFLFL